MKVLQGAEEFGSVEPRPYDIEATFSLQVIKQLPAIDYVTGFSR